MFRTEAAPYVGLRGFLSPGGGLHAPLGDHAKGKGPRDRVKDHGARALGDGQPAAHVEADQRGDVVEAILLELEQLPGVTLSTRRTEAELLWGRSSF